VYIENKIRVIILLFLIATQLFSSEKDEIKKYLLNSKTYNSYIWKNLLHLNNGNPSIDNDTFLLSHTSFTPKKELIKTIDLFYSESKRRCSYPARYLWINSILKNGNLKLPKSNCKDFEKYKKEVNPKKIKLVFVSEDITNPSSMMGHTFFKLESHKDDNSYTKRNAVSFFTVINSINVPSLLTKSLITGMKGYFLLSPYQKQINQYLFKEKRNIWEYDLILTDFQMKLIYFHFWELKNIDMKYLFMGFNCATIIDDMLALTSKDYKENNLWITPKDVIKNANLKGIISKSKLIPSYEWEVKMLIDSIDKKISDNIIDILDNKQYELISKFSFSNNKHIKYLEKKLFISYSLYQLYNKKIISLNNLQEVAKLVNLNDEYNININNYKNPINTQNDSQTKISYSNNNVYRISFLPANNTLYDNNKEYFIESSLEIGKIILINKDDKLSIEEFNLYNIKSLIPYDRLTKYYSKEFKLNYEQHYNSRLESYSAYNLSGGLGLTKQIESDIFVYGFLKLGIGYDDSLYGYINPQLGIIVYEIWNMKTILEYDYIYNQDNSSLGYTNLNLTQSVFIDNSFSIELNINKKKLEHIELNEYTVGIKYIF
jgi:hypothetical protein